MARLTFRKVNAELAKRGIKERLVQGSRGYLYFIDGDAFSWYDQSIPVCWLNQCTLDDILWWHNELSTDYRNH